jgi:hypothetical protein
MYIKVPPLAFNQTPLDLILNPLDKKSSCLLESVVSEKLPFGNNDELATLYVFLAESITIQSSDASVLLINTYRGLNPVKIKAPSVEPFPVYEPIAEYPATGAKQ